jgi:hypothetical protein
MSIGNSSGLVREGFVFTDLYRRVSVYKLELGFRPSSLTD